MNVYNAMNITPHFTLGRFLGMTQMIEKGLITPAQFIDSCICIAKEYEEGKVVPEPPYKAQAKRIADSYNATAKREERPDLEQGDYNEQQR